MTDNYAPGQLVRHDRRYLAYDEARRRYWQIGVNGALDSDEQRKLSELAAMAARRSRAPRAGMDGGDRHGCVDHGVAIRTLAAYVNRRMPRGDIPGKPAPQRPLPWLLRSGVLEREGVQPQDTRVTDGEPGWVCINAVVALGALLRALCYPVRECNVYLGQGGSTTEGPRGATYQEAALQVWFDGRWHWVDPYLGIFNPAFTRDDRSLYKWDQPYYWDGLVPPAAWMPGEQAPSWRRLEHPEEVGTHLHRRFFPKSKNLEEHRTEPRGSDPPRVRHLATSVERCGTATSGVWLRVRGRRVVIRLVDDEGRVCDARRAEIAGANHITAGLPVPFLSPDARRSEPVGPFQWDSGGPCHPESVFVGTASLLAEWEEVGTRTFMLVIDGCPDQNVEIDTEHVSGHHHMIVRGIPSHINLTGDQVTLRFQVTVAPVDADFHARFTRLLRRGLASPSAYWAAADDFLAQSQQTAVPR